MLRIHLSLSIFLIKAPVRFAALAQRFCGDYSFDNPNNDTATFRECNIEYDSSFNLHLD